MRSIEFKFRSFRAMAFALPAILFISAAAFAQTATRSSLAEQAALVTEFDVNGLKVLVKKRPASATVSAGIFFRGGTKNLGPTQAGLESFTLNTATEASQKFPRDVMRREMARTASSIGAGSNYDFSVLSLGATKENFESSWAVFTDVALNPVFSPEDIELTRKKMLTGIMGREDDPDTFLQYMVDRTILGKTAYGNDPNGVAETVSKFTQADLRAYHKKMLETSRMLIVVVGDVDAELVKKMVTASFGKLPRGTYKEAPVPTLDFSKGTLDITQRQLPTNYINGIFRAPSLTDADYYAMRVAMSILNERVFEEVRVKQNLSYAPSADMGKIAANTGAIYVSAVNANQAVRVMLDEIQMLKDKQIDSYEMSGVSGQFLTTYFIGQETNAAQAGELARYELIGGGWRRSFEFLDKIQRVTPADVQTAAKKYMTNLRFVVIGDPAKIDRSIFVPAG